MCSTARNFHRSTALYDYDQINYYDPNGIFDPVQFNTFGVNKDHEINIFFMGQNTNRLASFPHQGTYAWLSGGASGLGFLSAAGQSTDGSNNIWTKMGNMWRVHILAKRNGAYSDVSGWPWPLDETGKMLNHEIGHLLTLGHPDWSSETCADNPPTTGGGNNTMVSGADQLALTPCQIGRMQAELGSYYEAYADCNPALPCRAFFTVPETINSCNAPQKVPFDGRGSFNEDRWALSVVEVDANNQPSAPPLLTTQANGPVGQLYIGPLAPYRRYLVALSVYRGPTQSHTVTQYINTACLSRVGPNQPPPATALYPNPATADFTVPYGEEPTALPIVRDDQGQPAAVERTASRYAGGQWHVTYRFAQPVPAGLYRVETGRGATRRVRVLSLQRP